MKSPPQRSLKARILPLVALPIGTAFLLCLFYVSIQDFRAGRERAEREASSTAVIVTENLADLRTHSGNSARLNEKLEQEVHSSLHATLSILPDLESLTAYTPGTESEVFYHYLREGATLIVSDLAQYEGNQRVLSEARPALTRLGPVTSKFDSFRIDPPGPGTDLGRSFFDIHHTSNDHAWPRVNNELAFLVLEREDGS